MADFELLIELAYKIPENLTIGPCEYMFTEIVGWQDNKVCAMSNLVFGVYVFNIQNVS